MVRTVLAILSIALLSACGLKGPLYMTDENGRRQEAPQETQQQPSGVPSDSLLQRSLGQLKAEP